MKVKIKKKITIAQILPSLNSGGVERGTLEISEALIKKDIKSIVISGGGRLVDNLIKIGAIHLKLNLNKSPFCLISIPILIYIIIKYKIDIIHARSRLPAWIVYLSLKLIPKKLRPYYVTTVHGFNSVSYYSSVMTKSDKVIVVSNSVNKFIQKNYNIDKKNIELIYRGVPKKLEILKNNLEFKLWKKNWNKEFKQISKKKILLLPARVSRHKGIEIFIYLIKKLKLSNHNIIGLIVGEAKSKNYMNQIKKNIFEQNLEKDILFLGYRSDIYKIISISYVTFALQTIPESFGRIVIESIKLKTPVIGFDHGGVGEQLNKIFPQGLVKANDINGLCNLTISFLKKLPKVKRTSLFSLEEMQNKTLKIYEDLINKLNSKH